MEAMTHPRENDEPSKMIEQRHAESKISLLAPQTKAFSQIHDPSFWNTFCFSLTSPLAFLTCCVA